MYKTYTMEEDIQINSAKNGNIVLQHATVHSNELRPMKTRQEQHRDPDEIWNQNDQTSGKSLPSKAAAKGYHHLKVLSDSKRQSNTGMGTEQHICTSSSGITNPLLAGNKEDELQVFLKYE